MGILSAYTIHKLGKNESYDNFRNETDKSTIVHLKCPSHCPFNMHIISIITSICYIPLFINNA